MRFRFLISACSLALLSASAFGQKAGVVSTIEGARYYGKVTDERSEVRVENHGITTLVPATSVAAIDYGSFDEVFTKRLDTIDKEDLATRLQLTREAIGERRFDLARVSINEAMRLDPNDPTTRQLEMHVASAISRAKPGIATIASQDPPATSPATTPATSGPTLQPMLSEAQINLIRQSELGAGDTNTRVRFENNVKRRFVDAQPGMDFRVFDRMSEAEKARMILTKGTPEMKKDIQVASDPMSIQVFSKTVHTAIVQGCATSNCHGGPTGGTLRFVTGSNTSAAIYTNFYILTSYKVKIASAQDGSVFGGDVLRTLVVPGQPDESLLLQYGMNQADAKYKHPAVKVGINYNGIFRNRNDPKYQAVATWIAGDLGQAGKEYNLDFALPGGGSATTRPAAPASQPAK